jgi:YtkA-like protein
LTATHANRRILIAVVGLIVLAVAAFAALHMTMSPPADLDLARAKASEKRLYQVAIEPEAGPPAMGTLHSWLLTLKTPAGQPVADATITVDGGMPQHGHGLPTSPVVSADPGAGKYRVEGVKFTMTGWWQLRFAITAPAGSDSAVFNVKL